MIAGNACCCFGVGVGASKCGTSWGTPGSPGCPRDTCAWTGPLGGQAAGVGVGGVQMRVAVACTGCCCCCLLLVVSVTVMMVVPQFSGTWKVPAKIRLSPGR